MMRMISGNEFCKEAEMSNDHKITDIHSKLVQIRRSALKKLITVHPASSVTKRISTIGWGRV